MIRQGRQLRRRRRATVGVAGLAVTAILAGGGFLGHQLLSGPEQSPTTNVAATPELGPVYAAGSTVVVGDVKATVPHTVHDLVFTSAGILVRSNQNGGASDGSGPEYLTLVKDDGSTTDLGVLPGDRVGPATDPAQPYYALAEKTGSGFEAVIRDVRSGDVVKRVALPDQPKSYWDVPPLSLHGDQVFAGFKNSTWSINWRTGNASQIADSDGGVPTIASGRFFVVGDNAISVRDIATDQELLSVPTKPTDAAYADLSPDGRSLLVVRQIDIPESFTLYDVQTGKSRDLKATGNGWWQWTPEGDALAVTKDGITVCGVADACTTSDLAPGLKGELVPGGNRRGS